MLTLDSFPNRPLGRIHKHESDMIMERTWNTDITAQVAYLYDFFHDNHIHEITGLNPQEDENKIPVDIKFLKNASQTFEKDSVTFHIQFRPHFKYDDTDLVYYDSLYKDVYGSTFPVGMYIDIRDEKGQYNKWMVVNVANYYVNQFPTYEVLPVNHILQYIVNNIKYEIPVVLRSQSSYNSGVWLDYKIESTEDVQKFICPLNRETEKIFYNQRMIIDANVLTEPRAWRISKVNRINPNGCLMATLAQDTFDQNKDLIDETGMWADYYESQIAPTSYSQDVPVPSAIHSEIVFTGTKSEIKIGGSNKTFTAKYYDGEEEIASENGVWTYAIDGADITADVADYLEITTFVDEFKIKFKFVGESKYIGSILTVTYTSENATASIDVAIVSL